MAIQQIELMHGAVLLKICRNDNPLTLTLIENDGSRSAYRLNGGDDVLYVKHSTSPRITESGVTVWQFTFTKSHIEDIVSLADDNHLYLALVCAQESLDQNMEVAFLQSDEVRQCLILDNPPAQQPILVKMEPGRSLRISGKNNEPLVISRNSLDRWIVPGR